MIASFPKFTKLDIELQKEVQTYTDKFDPYSDFNFTSLFSWNVDGTTEISDLNGNLVIKLPDYITGESTYSILGVNEIDKSLKSLLSHAHELKLVPEVVINSIKDSKAFSVNEDRDQFDYIYPMENQADLAGGKYKVKRNKVNKFLRVYNDKLIVKKIDFKDQDKKNEIVKLFQKWSEYRIKEDSDTINEATAINRLIEFASYFNLIGIEVYIDNTLIGFSINEIVQNDYAICHFQKALLDFQHVDVFLSNIVAKELKHHGCKYVNWEQDLGIPGLRELKESYLNEFFFKKYIVNLS